VSSQSIRPIASALSATIANDEQEPALELLLLQIGSLRQLGLLATPHYLSYLRRIED
jgi:hypothetical protein